MQSKLEEIEGTLWVCTALLAILLGVGVVHLFNEHAIFLKALAITPTADSVKSGSSQAVVHAMLVALAGTSVGFVGKAAVKLRRLRKEKVSPLALAAST